MTLVNSFPSKSWLIFLLLGAFGRLHAQTIPAVNEYPMGWFGPAVSAVLATTQTSAEDNEHPTGLAGSFGGTIQTGAGGFDPKERNAHRTVTDLVVPGAVTPFTYTRTWNSRGDWRHNWQWEVEPWTLNTEGDHSGPPFDTCDVFRGYIITFPDGRAIKFRKPAGSCVTNGAPGTYPATMSNPEYLVIDPDQRRAHLHLADGSILNCSNMQPGAESFGFDNITDPHGLVTTFSGGSADMTITEPGGRWIKISVGGYSYNTHTSTTVVTSSLGQSVTYVSHYDYYYHFIGEGTTFEMTVTYNDVVDPATNLPLQARYLYKKAQPEKTGADRYNPNAPPPPPIYRLEWASDPMFEGPVQQAKYVYGGPDDPGKTAVLEVRYCTNYFTDPGVLLSRVEMLPYTISETGVNSQGYYERNETRGDGATRLISYWNTTNASPSIRVDHVTDWNNPNLSERYEYGAFHRMNKVTDMRGKVTTRILEPVVGNPTRETHHDTSYRSWTYTDPAYPYYVHTKRDERGHPTVYTRDPTTHLVTRIDYPDGSFETFDYNSFGQVTGHRMTSGGTEHFRYDGRGLKYLYWPPATPSDPNPQDHPTRYFYDSKDRLEHVTDPRGKTTSYQYNGRHQVTRITHADNNFIQNDYNPDGTLAWTADENHPNASWNVNERTRHTYDEYKRLLTVTNPMNETTTNCYAPWSGSGALSHTSNSIYQVTLPSGKVTHFNYDENFRRYVMRQAPGTADDAWTWFSYDPAGNLETTTDPRGKVTRFGYDDRNRQRTITSVELNETTTIDYDDVGNKTKEIRHDGSFRRWEYDEMNRLQHTYGFMSEHTEYERDDAGNATKIIDAKGAVYDFVFDDLNRKIGETYPPDQYGVRRTETWQYDAAGNLELYKSPANQSKNFLSDERNRLRHAWWNDDVGNYVETRYDAASRVTDIITNGGDSEGDTIISYGYDDANRKVWEDQTLAGQPTRRVETPRDDDGNREALQVGAQYYIGYGYTWRNQLADIHGFCHFTYDPSGNMIGREGRWIYTNAANFEHDALNRVKMGEQGTNGWIFARSHYKYDSNSREVATWRDEQSSKGERFAYNPANQLTKVYYNADSVWETDNPQNETRKVDYTYTSDTLSRQSVNDNGAVTDYGVSELNQYTYITGQGAHYDNNFNLWFLNGGYVYYDADKRVKSVLLNGEELLRCTYDGLGRVVRRTESGTTTLFTYDEWNQIVEWDEWGNFKAWNIYGARADEIIARYDAVYGPLIYKQDKLGNVVAVLGWGGEILEKYTYDVFGQPKVTDWYGNDHGGASWYGNRFMFTGREYLAWIASYDYRNRFYRPSLGRFFQVDPIGLHLEGAKLSAAAKAFYPSGQAPESFASTELNLYRYCHNDPVNKSDPTGLEDENYFDNGFLGIGREPLRKWITRSPDDNRTFTIGAHGVEGGRTMWDANRKIEMTPRQLFDRTKNNSELQKAERVMLYSCELGAGGKNSFAQKYANLTGKTVMAPTKELWVDKKGNYFSAGTLPKVDPNNAKEAPRPDYSDISTIRIFHPGR